MPRTPLESRYTFDEMFGLESEDATRRRDAIARIESEIAACEQEWMSIEKNQEDFIYGYKDNKNKIYFKRTIILNYIAKSGSKRHDINKLYLIYYDLNKTDFWMTLPGSRLPDLFPPLKYWLFRKIYYQTTRDIEAEYRLEWSIERLSELIVATAQFCADRLSSTITFALTSLRMQGPVATSGGPSSPTPGELIGELLSPRVLAAGGGVGLFVTLC